MKKKGKESEVIRFWFELVSLCLLLDFSGIFANFLRRDEGFLLMILLV